MLPRLRRRRKNHLIKRKGLLKVIRNDKVFPANLRSDLFQMALEFVHDDGEVMFGSSVDVCVAFLVCNVMCGFRSSIWASLLPSAVSGCAIT